MSYSLELRNPYFYKKKFSIALLHFTAGFLLLNAWYETNVQSNIPWLGILFLVVAFFEILIAFFAFKIMHHYPKINGIIRIITSASFLVYAILLFTEKQTVFAIFMLVIAIAFVLIYFIERRWVKPFVIEINPQGVLFPGSFKTPLIPWKNFNNLILKDSILTLDLTSNRVIQLELRTMKDLNRVAEINSFCQEKIANR